MKISIFNIYLYFPEQKDLISCQSLSSSLTSASENSYSVKLNRSIERFI